MEVAVTGAAGFLGRHTVDRLLKDGHRVTAIVHGEPPARLDRAGIVVAKADVSDVDRLAVACDGAQAGVHLVAIIKEGPSGKTFDSVIAQGTRNFIAAAHKACLEKIVYVSAMGTEPNSGRRYFEAKWRAEEAVRRSKLTYTILRPSTIFGPEDEFVNLFAGKFMPLPGGGESLLQPIFVNDVASIISRSLELPGAQNQTFELGGPERMRLRDIIAIAEKSIGRRRWHPPVPLPLAKLGAKLFFDPLAKLGFNVPGGSDAVDMLGMQNICSDEELDRTTRTFGLRLTTFEEGLRSYFAKK